MDLVNPVIIAPESTLPEELASAFYVEPVLESAVPDLLANLKCLHSQISDEPIIIQPKAPIETNSQKSSRPPASNAVKIEPDLESNVLETMPPCSSNSVKLESKLEPSLKRPRKSVQKPTHECHYCHKSFKQAIKLRDHLTVHTGEKVHSCSVCGKKFARKEYVYRHMVVHNEAGEHQCKICKKVFPQLASLKRHMYIHTAKKKHECEVCGKTFLMRSTFLAHQQVHLVKEERQFVCTVCGKGLGRKETLKHHMMFHRGERPFVCELCDRGFTKRYALNRHRQRHKAQDEAKTLEKGEFTYTQNNKSFVIYNCRICSKGYKLKVNLDEHLARHTGEELPHKCSVCEKRFLSVRRLLRHEENHRLKQHVCGYCPRTFVNKADYGEHVAMHIGKRNLPCKRCGKKFITMKRLRLHYKKIHTKRQLLFCEQCGKGCRDLPVLNSHKLTHRGEPQKKIKCETCGQCFGTIGWLNTHKMDHLPNCKKQFPCGWCWKRFPTNSKRNIHQKRVHPEPVEHTDLSQIVHECGECLEVFKTRDQLVAHSHQCYIDDQPYQCLVCPVGYHKMHCLIEHLVTSHTEYSSMEEIVHSEAFLIQRKEHNTRARCKCQTCEHFTLLLARRQMNLSFISEYINCRVCVEGFASADTLSSHIEAHCDLP